MLVFSWDDRFLTGIQVMDEQHQELVRIVNQLSSSLVEGLDVARFEQLFARLSDYARIHFSTEEDLMIVNDLAADLQQAHRAAHQQFIDEVLLLKHEAEADLLRAGGALIRYLIGWLTFHILGADRLLGLQLQAIQAGQSLEQVQQKTLRQDDDRAALLVDVLEWMSDMLVSKSRALQQCRADQVRAEEHLRQMTEEFESRVRARTDELFSVNEALKRDCLELKKLVQALEAQPRSRT